MCARAARRLANERRMRRDRIAGQRGGETRGRPGTIYTPGQCYDYDNWSRPRRAAATTRHREPFEPERAATSRREPAEHGITEFSESLCPTHEENWCELGQLLQALGHQRWTMLLMLMLACAELFVPGLLLLQLRKAWVVTVSSTYHRHTVCTHAVCTCTGTYPCGMYMCRHTHVPPIGKQVIR